MPDVTPGEWKAERGNAGAEHPLFITAPDRDGIRPWCDGDALLMAASKKMYKALALYVEHFGDPLKVARPALLDAGWCEENPFQFVGSGGIDEHLYGRKERK